MHEFVARLVNAAAALDIGQDVATNYLAEMLGNAANEIDGMEVSIRDLQNKVKLLERELGNTSQHADLLGNLLKVVIDRRDA